MSAGDVDRFDAYRAGEIDLFDPVREGVSNAWGVTRTLKSRRELRK